MRSVGLGQWLYYAWHLPTLLLSLAALGLAAAMGRSLWRDALSARAAYLRWSVLGWSGVLSSLLCTVAWPYLGAVATVRVDRGGDWRLENYLGVELARVPAGEVRTVRALDLGGLRLGSGHVEFVRADGTTLSSVRIGGRAFGRLCDSLGYTAPMLREAYGAVVIPAHTYTPRGPALVPRVASR